LNEGCLIEGIGKEKKNLLFIPNVMNVKCEEEGESYKLTFKGESLMKCVL